MVSSQIDSCLRGRTEVLNDWISKFRHKKVQMKRQRRDLRITAILTKAMYTAEAELRHKQQERASRWNQLQSRYVCKVTEDYEFDFEKERIEKEKIDSIWNEELNDLDKFLSQNRD